MIEQLNDLLKALEAGQYNAAPGTLSQGSALQVEDLSPIMENVCFDDAQIKLQKTLSVKDAKSTLVQFNRQLDYGTFGGSAQSEGGIGEEDTSSIIRAVVPMSYYSTTRRVTVAANMIAAFDGQKAEDRAGNDAAKKIAADIEFDLFKGMADFTNLGVFDGNPATYAKIPNMHGIDSQIRLSDSLSNTQDLMFAEYGSDQSVILPVNGTMTQSYIEDASVKSAMNHGSADKLLLDPISLSAYNKIAHAKERIVLAGSAQEASGANLRTQWTSNAPVTLEASRFLSGKTRPARARSGSPAATTFTTSGTADTGSVLPAATYSYYVTTCNERGESVPSPVVTRVVAAGERANLTIAAVTAAKYFNVYRGLTAATAKYIGRIAAGAGAVIFRDLGLRSGGSVTGLLLQSDTWEIAQLAPYSTLKLAISNLSMPSAHFRFLCLKGTQPRKNVILDNVAGQLS